MMEFLNFALPVISNAVLVKQRRITVYNVWEIESWNSLVGAAMAITRTTFNSFALSVIINVRNA
jgi:hypothetical protein